MDEAPDTVEIKQGVTSRFDVRTNSDFGCGFVHSAVYYDLVDNDNYHLFHFTFYKANVVFPYNGLHLSLSRYGDRCSLEHTGGHDEVYIKCNNMP